MKKLGMIALAILLLAMDVVSIDSVSTHSTVTRVRKLRVGDSKHEVEHILGRPVSVFKPLPEARTNLVAALLSVGSETWAYGSRLDLRQPFCSEFPYFYPFRLRLFKPDSDDVAIEFDSGGRISKIVIP